MATRNPAWAQEELILALDIYFRCNPLHTSERNPEIVALSDLLNRLPIHVDRPDARRFRNPNGVYMKLCNFLRCDPSYTGKGLTSGGKLDQVVWDAFAEDREKLRAYADALRAFAGTPPLPLPPLAETEEEDVNAPEGRLLLRQHRTRERNHTLIRKKKAAVLRDTGELRCEVCGFCYAEHYGEIGDGFIECHHTLPVSELRPGQVTYMKDLALVCANCHRMLHVRRGKEVLTVDALRTICRVKEGAHCV